MSTSDLKNTPHGAVQSLEPNRLYEGVVENCDPVQNVFSVRVGATLVSPCKWGAGIMSGMLGIRTNYLPPPNTRVVLAYFVSGSIVVGSVPHSLPHASGVKSRQLTGGGAIMNRDGRQANAGNPASTQALGNNPPIDLLEGEVEVASAMGAGIDFLTNLTRLKAGDLAKVEVSLIDDTVRLVSDHFVHFTAFGNKEDYNDGRLNSRVEGTSYPFEAFGLAAENLPKVTFGAANADGSGSTLDINLGKVDEIYGTLRSRYSQFLGFLGDFINQYVTDPATALGAAAAARSGKFREHVGNDGGYLVQSVADITFERVCRIPVPIERTRWDDPTGNLAAGFDTLAAGPLKAWVYDPNPANIFQGAYQLRHYARWLSGVYGLARYQQLQKDWAIPTEAQTPAPDRNSGEADRKAANAGLPPAYIDTYATMRIYRDGSIQLFNGYGCSVNMAGPDVQVSAARNLHLEAAGDMVLVAGQNFVVKARQSVEITAAHGGLILKARTWFRSIVTAGSMWFRSEAIDPGSANYTVPAADSNQDPVPQVLPAAILFQAPYGKTELATANELGVNVTGNNLPAGTVSGVRVWTDGEIIGQANNNVTLSSRLGSIVLKAANDLVVGAQRFMNYLTFGVFDVNNHHPYPRDDFDHRVVDWYFDQRRGQPDASDSFRRGAVSCLHPGAVWQVGWGPGIALCGTGCIYRSADFASAAVAVQAWLPDEVHYPVVRDADTAGNTSRYEHHTGEQLWSVGLVGRRAVGRSGHRHLVSMARAQPTRSDNADRCRPDYPLLCPV